MTRKKYTIQNAPVGLSLPQSAIDIMQGLTLPAKVEKGIATILKEDLVTAVTPLNKLWAQFLNNHTENEFKFIVS